jgi:peptidoglycan/xylan/chitin deacetylase (PgdA/CDA1 family)
LKNKLISVIVNVVLCAIIVGVSLVGFAGGSSVAVSTDGEDAIYDAGDSAKGVSLMFNVYQNTQNVKSILDILDEYSAKATFFIGGCWADDNVDCVREIANRGHEIASHGYFHKDHSEMTYSDNLDEIRTSVKLLNMITLGEVALFAPPSGAFNDGTLSACKSLGLKTIMWSRDTIDWRDDDVSLIYSRATDGLKIGEFVLMHPMNVTVKALPKVLKYMKDNGLNCVTVSNNLE